MTEVVGRSPARAVVVRRGRGAAARPRRVARDHRTARDRGGLDPGQRDGLLGCGRGGLLLHRPPAPQRSVADLRGPGRRTGARLLGGARPGRAGRPRLGGRPRDDDDPVAAHGRGAASQGVFFCVLAVLVVVLFAGGSGRTAGSSGVGTADRTGAGCNRGLRQQRDRAGRGRRRPLHGSGPERRPRVRRRRRRAPRPHRRRRAGGPTATYRELWDGAARVAVGCARPASARGTGSRSGCPTDWRGCSPSGAPSWPAPSSSR